MLTTYAEIKQQVLDEWDTIKDAVYPEDLLSEWADSNVPVYYSDIIHEWTEMPRDYDDRWRDDFGNPGDDFTITKLMQIDLYCYYYALFGKAFIELRHDLEQDAE